MIMKYSLTMVFAVFLAVPNSAPASDLDSPLDWQVSQRNAQGSAEITVAGNYSAETGIVEAKTELAAGQRGKAANWTVVAQGPQLKNGKFSGSLKLAAGGWYTLKVRFRKSADDQTVLGESVVEHLGVGEVFVVAGQSNSANYGEEKQTTKTGSVAAFDGHRWQLANDPQPGASGGSGSFMPPFGDTIAEKFKMPVGFVACGIGATSVREWLPKGTKFPNPPTLTGRVQKIPSGEWESKGQAFDMLAARMKQLGPNGFRAVLWHQGESDANQADPQCTLPGNLYRQYLEQVIKDSRRQIGWDAPWFVALVSYHTPGDEASPEIRAAQKGLWENGIALEGPDSDALKGDLRENHGRGVHFSGAGLREHAARWVEKVEPWLEGQSATSTSENEKKKG